MDGLLTLDAVSKQTGTSVRRLREWCAAGRLKYEREGAHWQRLAALAATASDSEADHPVAVAVPAEGHSAESRR